MDGYETFEAFCKEEWDLTPTRSRQLRLSARAYGNLESVKIFTVLPSNEGQATELLKLKDPDTQREAWKRTFSSGAALLELAGDKKVTAKLVKKVVDEFTAPYPGKKTGTETPPEGRTSIPV